MSEPRDIAEEYEKEISLPSTKYETFAGYGIIGLPFSSGHVLALRRFPLTSIGPGYTSIWHRDPEGKWIIVHDMPAMQSCPRFFGSALERTVQSPITVTWTGPRDLRVKTEGEYKVDWKVSLNLTVSVWFMNIVGGLIPGPLWRTETFLSLMGRLGRVVVGAGRMNLVFRTPNGQKLMATPKHLWPVHSSSAIVNGQDMGVARPLPRQARLGQAWVPQRGRFFDGYVYAEPFNPVRHHAVSNWHKLP